jgi:hypothetical protein
MDRHEKLRLFGLYTSLKSHGASLMNEMFDEATEVHNHYPEAMWLAQILPATEVAHLSKAPTTSLFNKVRSHRSDDNHTAFLVNAVAHLPRLDVDDVAKQFNIMDFRGALGDYFSLKQTHTERRGQRRSAANCFLSFTSVHVWKSF